MNEIIQTSKATKHFGAIRAVEAVDISVRKGEIYGFIGLNGAGKTTTIRMILGMIRPTSGDVYLKGRKVDAGATDLWKITGYLVEAPYAYPDLTVFENLEIARRLRGLESRTSVERIMEKLAITQYRDRKARNLSQGNGQRLGIAKALIHDPEILILDEPANGLDPAGIAEIRELLKDLALNKGVTIFLSSHILGEISKFATRIGIIHEGALLQEVDAGELDSLLRRRLLVRTEETARARSSLETWGYETSLNENGEIEILGEEALSRSASIVTELVKAGLPPVMVKPEEEDLETYFLRVIGSNGGAA
ncbi:MAG: ABC transporter ATP-binding protein [Spirochaetales bacterium]|nr:MAG: ABC transporter ATP-binding protein [Spirochaetales bacterium]